MPDIKWCELYFKWGKFVPEEKKEEFRYFKFNERPTKEMVANVKSNSKSNKATRKDRGRTTQTDTAQTGAA